VYCNVDPPHDAIPTCSVSSKSDDALPLNSKDDDTLPLNDMTLRGHVPLDPRSFYRSFGPMT